MRFLLAFAPLVLALFSGCAAIDNGCGDGMWGASDVEGTMEEVGNGRFRATGILLCDHKFSIDQTAGLVRYHGPDDDAEWNLRWGDLRFETEADGIVMVLGDLRTPMTPDSELVPPRGRAAPLVAGDEIGFCRTPARTDPHVHVELEQVRHRAWLHDESEATISFETLPPCA